MAQQDYLRLLIQLRDDTQQGRQAVIQGLDRIRQSAQNAERAASATAGSLSAIALSAGAFVTALAGSEVTKTLAEFDKLNASLKTVTGSLDNAKVAAAFLQDFSTNTPFELDEVTQAFVKLKSLGFDASAKSLREIGNAAAAMNTTLADAVDSVAAAARGEFDPIEKFGVQIRKEGERLRVTFKGVTQEIENSAQAIQAEFGRISNLNFSTGITDQLDTIGGRLSNLSDSWKNLVNFIGNLGLRDAIKSSVAGATDFIVVLQKQLNALFGSGLRSQIDAFELQAASQARVLEQLQRLNRSPVLGEVIAPTEEIERRQEALINTNKALADLRKQLAALDAQQGSALDKIAAPVDAKPVADDAKARLKAQQDAAKEALKARLAELEALRQTIKDQFAREAAENEAFRQQELTAAGDNAQKRIEIEARYAATASARQQEELARLEEVDALQKKAVQDKAEILKIDAEIGSKEAEIARIRSVGAIEAQTFTLQEQQAILARSKALDDLVNSYDRTAATIAKVREDAARAIELGATDAQLQKIVDLGNAQVAALTKVDAKSKETEANGDRLGRTFASAFEDAVIAGESFSDVLAGIGQDLARLAVRQAFDGLLDQLSQVAKAVGDIVTQAAAANAAGTGGGILGTVGSIVAGFFHGGGTVGAGGTMRTVPALAFAGAPRMHTGGRVGLRSDERAAILQTGETVLPRGVSPGGTQVQIIDQRGANAPPVDVQRSSDGQQEQIKVFIRQTVAEWHNSGAADKVMAQNHGTRRPGRRV